jgi:CheY-like chemotaxis protein
MKKILLADDDPAIVDALSLMLEDAGYEVEVTLDGTAVGNLSEDPSYRQAGLPDLILLDLWMSGVNGGDICKQLKLNPITKNISIVIISANKDGEKIAAEVGADGFIAKPFEMKDFLAAVEKFV